MHRILRTTESSDSIGETGGYVNLTASKMRLKSFDFDSCPNKQEKAYHQLIHNSVDKPKMLKLFGTDRIPWGLARNRKKYVPSFNKAEYESL